MRMAHGSHQTLAAEQCSLVPSGIELKDACWCGLAKTAFRAAWAAEPLQGATVLVIGAGPVGQMAIRWLAARGAGRILVADFSEYRLQHAKRGGADTLFAGDISCHAKEIQRVDDGKGPSIVIDTTGNPKAFVHAMDAAARFGKIILLGDTGYPDRQHLSSAMMSKGLTVQATHDNHDRDGWTQRRIDEEFFGLVTDGKFDPGGLISHELSPKQCKQAYDIAENDRDNAMGILFDWSLLP